MGQRRAWRRALPKHLPHHELTNKGTAIDLAIDFARTHDMQPWDETLAHARDLDLAEQPEPPYHADTVFPGHLGKSRRRLLAMATGAHVFDDMGSWNDFLFADECPGYYDAVSHRLFAAIMRAFSASVNTPDPASQWA